VFLDWPKCEGRESLADVASRLVEEADIGDGDVVAGCSLGGMVAGEIARIRRLDCLVLISSARHKAEINSLLAALHPLIDVLPVEFVQRCAARLPSELSRMFSRSQPEFVRRMCRAIFTWEGSADVPVRGLRIHGRKDRVIAPPANADLWLEAGHLLAITHAAECVGFLRRNRPNSANP
jgi:pimeloyl-ACP methyl ester carboxylesterase